MQSVVLVKSKFYLWDFFDNHKGCLIYPLFEDSNKPLKLLERRTHELT